MNIDDVIVSTATAFNVEPRAILSRSHKRIYAQPRQVAMYLLRQHTQRTLKEIGRRFRRDHTTVLHAIAVVEKNLEAGSIDFRDRVDHAVVLMSERSPYTFRQRAAAEAAAAQFLAAIAGTISSENVR